MSIFTLKKKIRRKIKGARAVLDDHYPPALGGPEAAEFDGLVQEAGDASDDILQESFFAGITPTTKTQPTTLTMIEWFEDMAESASDIIDLPLPTAAQKQDAADSYYTISQDRGSLISEYTT